MTDLQLTTLERRLDIEVPLDVLQGAVQYLNDQLTPAWEAPGEALVQHAAIWPEEGGQHKQINFKTPYGHYIIADRFPLDLVWIVRAESAALTDRLLVFYSIENQKWEWRKL
jgi:hypothetical protein